MVVVPTMSVAHDARAIAQELIPEHHPHLQESHILYVFTDQKRKRCDRVRLGSAAKMNSLQRFLASGMDGVEQGPDFLILIDSNEWGTLRQEQRQALVDHELCHCAVFVKDEGAWQRWHRDMDAWDSFDEWRYGLRGHDLEEFAEVVKRYGFWRHDPQELEFKAIAIQLAMRRDGVARKAVKESA